MGRYSLIAVLCLLATSASAETLTGIVVGIADGDTLTLLDANRQQHKIRLMGIDAPESHQPFGQKSKTQLSAMTFNREATAECGKIDKYHRRICKIVVAGVDINLEQIKSGMAWHYKQYANEQSPSDREDYTVGEFNAKIRRLGLWSDKNPIPPWDWRRQ